MRSRRVLVSTLALGLVVPLVGTTAAWARPSPDPLAGSAPPPPPEVRLSGAFGTVLGGDPASPAGAAPANAPLDTWIRKAPLSLEISGDVGEVVSLSVASGPSASDAPAEQLSDGATVFEGPDTVGSGVIVATIVTEAHGTSEHAWLVEVPDRSGGEEALLDIPGPGARLTSRTGSVTGVTGHGCYAYLCVEVGYRPPTATLTALPVAVGETLHLELDDGSAMVGWKGILRSLDGSGWKPIEAEEAAAEAPQAALRLSGLEAGAAGEWLLELRVDYDRERGWQWLLFRLAAE